jgi:hypothetical protein
MKPCTKSICVVFAALFASVPAMAANSVLSDEFDGSEAVISHLPGGCDDENQLGYQQTGFQVSMDGPYTVTDAFHETRADIVAVIYQDSFDPNNPLANILTPAGIDESISLRLTTGVNYVVVVQSWCDAYEGAWALSFTGPGNVIAGNVVTVPGFTMGTFTNGDPTANLKCGDKQYIESGPIQLNTSGTYYYSDMSVIFDVDVCVQIYSAPFNSANPDSNLVARLDDIGQVELEAGKDYYFIAQPLGSSTLGDFFYILAPPAPFRINYLMSGSWSDPATQGQGFLLDVFDKLNVMFMAWFTFDLNRPDDTTSAQLGETGHRWLTVQGAFSGNTAPLTAYLNQGGVFDSDVPPVTTDPAGYGTVDLEFSDCKNGTLTYDLASSPPVAGVIPLKRNINDVVPLCEEITTGPGMPGLIGSTR